MVAKTHTRPPPPPETLLSTIEYNAMEYVPFQAQEARIEQFQEVLKRRCFIAGYLSYT